MPPNKYIAPKTFQHTTTGETIRIATRRDENGTWIAHLVGDENCLAHGPTRKAAEDVLLEDLEDIAIMLERQHEPLLDLESLVGPPGFEPGTDGL